MNVQCLRSPGDALMQFQIAAGGLVQFCMAGFILILQLQQPFMADHVGREFPGRLFVDIIHGDLVELVDPSGGILTAAHLEGSRGLYILTVEIKMSQHVPAVPGGEKAVSDKACQLLMDLVLIQRTEGQIDKNDGISLVFHCTGTGNDLFHIAADGTKSEIFGVQNTHVDQNTQVVVGGKPSGGYQLTADLHIICTGRGKDRQKDLVERVRAVTALYYIGGKGMGNHLCQIFHQKSKGVVKRYFSLGDHQTEHGSAGSGNINAELRRGELIAGIVEIACSIERLLIVNVLLEGVDNGLCCFSGAKNGVFQFSIGEFFGGNDRKIFAGHHHGVGYDRVRQIQKLLDGSVGESGIHKALVPAVIAVVEFLQKGQKFSSRYCLRKEAVAGVTGLRQMGAPAGKQNQIFGQSSGRQGKLWVINQIDDPVFGKKGSFVLDGIF